MTDEFAIVRTALPGHETALRDLLRAYFREANEGARERFPERLTGIDVDEAAAADLDRLAGASLDEPLFLARVGGALAGSVQLKRLTPTTAEVKRLYVVPEHRGAGLGRRLMQRVLDEAAADGFETLRLGVGPHLVRARALYEDLGFAYTDRYEQSGAPERVTDEWCFMRRSLADR